MRKTTDTTPNIDSGPVPNLRTLADRELDAVTGGYVPTAVEQGDIKITIGSQDSSDWMGRSPV